MSILGNLLHAIAYVLDTVLFLYFWVVIISAILSWVNPDPYNPIVRTIRSLTEPAFAMVRRWVPFTFVGGLDLSPIIVLLGIKFLQIFLVQSINQLAIGM
ncbi:YggT family protein [Desulfovermiculus halophilus]|jgi:YggT family protein|uniref:YggT family protein n=1 Tax=Desulfovermiculus halophilus TaxID=339722 RepID=UPI000485ADC3|nr:YggT family protein [Desulfovermiculus halophilus]